MDLREVGYDDRDWINLAQDWDQWQAYEAFNRKRTIFCGSLEKELRKKLVKFFVWSVALYGEETWTLRRNEEKRIEAFEMWMWKRTERVKWTDRIRNEVVLEKVGEERMMLKLIRKRKRNWLSLWLRRIIDDIRRLSGRQKIGKIGECWVCNERPSHRQNTYVAVGLNPDGLRRVLGINPFDLITWLGFSEVFPNQKANAGYKGWGYHRANHTVPSLWLEHRSPLLRHVDVLPVIGWSSVFAYSNQELAEIHFMNGKADGNAALALRLYQERYPQRQCPDRKTFVRLHYRLCEYGKFNSPGLGRGRPRPITPEVQEEILEAVNMTPSISTRRVALQVNVPHTTVWRLLKEYQLYPYHLQLVQALHELGSHVWGYENPRTTVPSHHQVRFSLNMWAGIIGDRLVGPHVLVNRLTGQAYTNFL
ncbi:hypothetical protein ANN_09999 [Periplaneta americana]|uniref:DUF4817 domain-containing protein n=1 Tax=Periplaneta americana TaxID=6978 RepID=A0ABQ8TN80_PERAM|nr:hypothetical protein ANN_09999 [Periplaneta americana]